MLKEILNKNISNKIAVLIIIILVLIGGGLIWRFQLLGIKKEVIQPRERFPEVTTGTVTAGVVELVKFPKEIIEPLEIEGIPTTDFSKNDKIGILGNLTIPKLNVVTFQIFDEKAQIIHQGELEVQFWQDDKFRICCIVPPEKPGEYTLQFFSNNQRVPIPTLFFRVVP